MSEEPNQEESIEKKNDEIKDFCLGRAAKKMAAVADFLEDVALNNDYKDKKQVKDALGTKIVEVPLPTSTRIAAVKIWKEMFMDKSVGDVKEKAKAKKNKTIDVKKTLREIGQEIERDAEDVEIE